MVKQNTYFSGSSVLWSERVLDDNADWPAMQRKQNRAENGIGPPVVVNCIKQQGSLKIRFKV
jgi:hypothetical protein